MKKERRPLLLSSDWRQLKKPLYRNPILWATIATILVAIAIFIMVYFIAIEDSSSGSSSKSQRYWEEQYLLLPSNSSLKNRSKTLSNLPRIAGNPQDFILANEIAKMFEKWGYVSTQQNISGIWLDHWQASSLSIVLGNSTMVEIPLYSEIIPGDPGDFLLSACGVWTVHATAWTVQERTFFSCSRETATHLQSDVKR